MPERLDRVLVSYSRVLAVVLDKWLEEDGIDRLPPGIFDLRNAIKDHLNGAETA